MKKKNKWLIGVGTLLLILIIWGIYRNPDRRTNDAINSYENIIGKDAQRKEELTTLNNQYKECFNPESADITTRCLEGLPKIKILAAKEPQTLTDLQSLYQNHKKDLNDKDRLFLEDNIKLLSSKEYQDFYKGSTDVLDAYIDFYSFLNEEIDTKGIDTASTKEESLKILSRGIANHNFKRELVVKNLTDLAENFELKKEMLRRYVEANFDPRYLQSLGI